MTARGAVTTIVACTLLLAAIGLAIGGLLGVFAPEYYRTVLPSGREPGFDPVAVGVGLGLTQGAIGGAAVGLGLVGLLCWRDAGARRSAGTGDVPEGALLRRGLRTFAAIAILAVCTAAALLAGFLAGERQAYQRRYREERQEIAPLLTEDPAFANVRLEEYSGGGAYLTGEVPTPADLERLRKAVARAVGDGRSRRITAGVHAPR